MQGAEFSGVQSAHENRDGRCIARSEAGQPRRHQFPAQIFGRDELFPLAHTLEKDVEFLARDLAVPARVQSAE